MEETKFHWEKFTDPQSENIILPLYFYEESQGNLFWKRPNEYIHEYHLSKDIVSSYPFRNTLKIKKFIYEMYNRDAYPIENRKFNRFISQELKNDYSSENKRNMKNFFKVFDKNDFYVVKFFYNYEEINNKEDLGAPDKIGNFFS